MMMSLFSMFDPSAMFNIQLNWIIMLFTLIIFPNLMWTYNSRISKVLKLIFYILHKEFSALFSHNYLYKGSTLICMSIFIFIMNNNITSNFPYTFCCSAHLSFSLSLSIPIWMSIILFYWMNLNKTMFSHLVPTGTPPILMPLMVMIEITSNIIRPLALGVRLSANLIAGHLLMALLGNTLNMKTFFFVFILAIQILFLMFEFLVAIIQSYVFAVLMTLYSSEIN
uniref:ATP synthase subunit a n=1 Tax=Pseudophacopteron sp. DMP-2018 TaxID=2908812 RepID=A0A344A2N8_9HEMI|nr:ATP synthase F0 subunit 6 [Pseudophacopteron sp. DMP-2018]